jgi:hypothetical protein
MVSGARATARPQSWRNATVVAKNDPGHDWINNGRRLTVPDLGASYLTVQ